MLLAWADVVRAGDLGVRQADNGADAANARRHGAEGIGLCEPSTCSSQRTVFRSCAG